ncbi:MAG: tetratricopeptide repeat protein [Imperialibacter sp.]|uniref:tetratricopeptide repeat-containing sensor histidine kinase n=1 Tax=Imperialibacter sp. TaxID=2038411 RepID=UPI0032EA9E02
MKIVEVGFWLFLGMVLCHPVIAISQNFRKSVDSLQSQLSREITDTAYVNTLNRISTELHGRNFREAIRYANLAIQKAEKIDYRYGVSKGYQNIGLASWANGRYHQSLENHKKSIAMFQTWGMTRELAEAYNKIGLVYFYIAEYEEAITYLNKSIEDYRSRKDTVNLARVLNNIGLVYDAKGDYATSTHYIIESLQLSQSFRQLRDQQNRTYGKGMIHENEFINRQILEERLQRLAQRKESVTTEKLANLYVEIAEIYFFLKEYNSALSYYRRASEIYAELDEQVLLAHCLRDQAECYVELADFGTALEVFRQSESIYISQGNYIRLAAVVAQLGETNYKLGNIEESILHYKRLIALDDSVGHRAALSKTKVTLAGILLEQGRKQEALSYAQSGYEIARKIGSLTRVETSARQLYECYKAIGLMGTALSYLEESTSLKQKFGDELTHREIAELQIQYESEEKQKAIDQLNEVSQLQSNVVALQKQLLMLMGGGFAAFAVILVVMRNRLIKIRELKSGIEEKNAFIEAQNFKLEKRGRERELLIGEIHHRVKNNLQVVSSMLRLQQRKVKNVVAKEALFAGQNRVQAMSLLHQRLYQHGSYGKIPIADYVSDVCKHLAKVYNLDKQKMESSFEADNVSLDIDTAVTIGLMANEVYSNIFKHAYPFVDVLRLHSEIKRENGLTIRITDNGPGLPKKIDFNETGFGLRLVEMLATELGGEAIFTSAPAKGLIVTMRISKAHIE